MEEKLPLSVIAQLYKNNLILAGTSAKSAPANKIKDIKNTSAKQVNEPTWLGKNQQNITIVLEDEVNKFIGEDNLSFLINILNACKLTPDDIAIVNIYRNAVDFTKIKATLNPRVMIFFDVLPESIDLQMQITPYAAAEISGVTLLAASNLSELNGGTANQKAEKAKLWQALKKIFSL